MILVLRVFPLAAPIVFVLLPIAAFIQHLRSRKMQVILRNKQLEERQCIAILADVVENTQSFRSLPGSVQFIRTELQTDTSRFSKITLKAVLHNTHTKEFIEIAQGLVLSGMLFVSCIMVNEAWDWGGLLQPATSGTALVVISAFIAGSKDLLDLSAISLQMRFLAEGLREVSKILNYPTDAHTMAHKNKRQQDMIIKRIQHSMSEFVDIVELDCALWKDPVGPLLNPEEAGGHTVELSTKFKLGGMIVLRGASEKEAETVLMLIAGLVITHESHNQHSIFVPPFLKLGYVPEMPVLVEGSIMKNLLMGTQQRRASLCKACKRIDSEGKEIPECCKICKRVSERNAWQIAERCGLAQKFIDSPGSFNVGKGGRNLPLDQRQAVSIARGILSDASVLMLHKPTSTLSTEHADKVLHVLDEYTKKGGVFGILSPPHPLPGHSPREYLIGSAAPTVIFTVKQGGALPQMVTRVVECRSKVIDYGAQKQV